VLPDGPWGDALEKVRQGLGSGQIIVLLGPRGTGKTQMAVEILRERIMAELRLHPDDTSTLLYTKARDIFARMRDAFRDGAELTEVQALRLFSEPDILVIDEAHERSDTAFVGRALTTIIDRRYDALRDTIIVSNQDRREFAAGMGESIVSRMREVGVIVECQWPSFREVKRD